MTNEQRHRGANLDDKTLFMAMAGGLLLGCCDGCIRDIASIHGTYRLAHETRQAIELIGILFLIIAG